MKFEEKEDIVIDANNKLRCTVTIHWIVYHYIYKYYVREKGRDLISPMKKTNTPTEKSQEQRDNTKKTATKNFDYTTIADRLRTVSWSNSSHPTGVVKPVHERSIFPLTATVV